MAKHKLFLPQDFLTEDRRNFPTLPNLLDKDVFPFSAPPGPPLPAMMIFPEVHEAPQHTTNGSKTKTAAAVEGLLDTDQELRQVRRAPDLWRNLARYADMEEGLTHTSTFSSRPQGSDIPAPPGLPDAQQQATAIYQIWNWFLHHVSSDEYAVSGEVAFQDVWEQHVIKALNIFAKMRYTNRVHESNTLWPDRESTDPVPENVHFPVWGRCCNEVRPDIGSTSNRKAGHPDWILFREPNSNCNVCLAEAKTWWSYPDKVFHEICTEDVAPEGQFMWTKQMAAGANDPRDIYMPKPWYLVKQVWGELIFYNTSWGFVTNGKVIMAYVKTGEHELTFSSVLDVKDSTLYKAMIGLCFAAIDGRRNDGTDSIDLIDQVCGPRNFNWPIIQGKQRRKYRKRKNPVEDEEGNDDEEVEDDKEGEDDEEEDDGMDID